MSRILVVGMGFVGEPLAEALCRAGNDVVGLTHSESSAERLGQTSAATVYQADVSDRAMLGRVLGQERFDWVVHCASSGRGGADQYRRVYLEGLENLLACCPGARVLFTSSTSVYGQVDGTVVTELSEAEPDRETGRILRETEELAIAAGGVVTRLAGIYGPGRSFILLKYLNGSAVIEGDGGRYLNQAHGRDIVNALGYLIESEANGIYNVVDSTPQTQREIYDFLAEHFGGEVPPLAPPDYERKRGWTHKRVSNDKLRGTGWAPIYPSFQDAVRTDPDLVPSIRALMDADGL